jgi:membrane-anchored protein YejM (alkaline phosphatase superfamily)
MKKKTDLNLQSKEQQELRHLIVRAPKDQAFFLYFQLEANEGLAFYSTQDQSLREAFRDIEIFSPICLTKELDHFMEYIQTEVPLLFLVDEIINDSLVEVESFSKLGKKSLDKI